MAPWYHGTQEALLGWNRAIVIEAIFTVYTRLCSPPVIPKGGLKPAREHSQKASQPRWVPGRKLRLVVAGRWIMAIRASSNSIAHHSTQKAGSYHLQALDGLPEGSFAGALYVHDQDHSVGLRSKDY
jgi:hypothetical protein